ncbi:glycosyltransferase [Chryseobacterium sp. MFBS3-17]|uniref:glycosyltransferase n=1 Tax=Chryseobacterium sp. MFBS3-17 TaxID=2886689 RepID=UPI001D0ECF67|nr:glycosyltransferase [Chryseobacterium sp. MFBS3-17]MCC2591361.1 glycosyltransferase [Chryseobacterium sp. MFBS3-17]
MTKTIFFVTGLDSGGLENYLLRFLKYKHTEFSDIIVYCKGGKGGILEEEYKKIPNVKIIKNTIGTVHPKDYINLYKWLKGYSDYSICDFTGNFAGPVLWSAKKAGIKKRIVFYRSSSNRFKESFFKMKINKFYNSLVLKYSTHILANSSYGLQFFFGEKLKDNRMKVIYNGIDATIFDGNLKNLRNEFNIPDDGFIVGHTGRFNEAKNHQTIINVAKKIVNKNTTIYFILCGKGVKENLLKTLTSEERKNILLFENRNDIPDFLNTMNLYFFPSITEGQPNSLIEAMILGKPFLASNIPSIKETVYKKYYHCLFDPLDENAFIKQIENASLSKIQSDSQLKKLTIEKFNHQLLFDEFYKEL